MLETKSFKVAVEEEQDCIDSMACFAWNCIGSQEINSKESHMEQKGDDLYSVTTSEHYVKLLFQRDTKHPCYSEIKNCESTYYSILRSKPVKPTTNVAAAFLGLCFFLLPGILYIVYCASRNSKYKQAYASWSSDYNNKAIPAKERARSLA